MKIGVMGTGGVGGYFGGFLARAGVDIHFVARGKHLQALQEEGLEVVTNNENFRVRIHATSEPEEIGPVDLLLFCVKSHDTEKAARCATPMVEADTTILTLQNGIDNAEKLAQVFGEEKILPGTVFIESTIASPGVIAHMGKPGKIIFGEFSGERTERVQKILETFQHAGIHAEVSDDIQKVLWAKFLFICGVHGVSTLGRAPLGLILDCPETREILEGTMKEVLEVSKKCGVALPDNAVEDALALAYSYNPKFKCSMLRDLEWHRKTEVEALNGMVVRLGKAHGVPVPYNSIIYAVMHLENKKIENPVWASQLLER
ncbi:ketopantoate reductase family protein [Desulfosoma caldarium]|uniref:2-dehydropantoate 2-reductase n=1 Tax=Desulfosoma caldarium TaxID=610254 RepID=A0A3N1UQT7_9BACT|nr:2-dehydropantoate 2-reductase [Desulfosoma caldarium]ROQ93455.1 ketopantoate reductase [Desulfosoma caldarium]